MVFLRFLTVDLTFMSAGFLIEFIYAELSIAQLPYNPSGSMFNMLIAFAAYSGEHLTRLWFYK